MEIREFFQNPHGTLGRVEQGESVTLARNGKPYVVLSRPEIQKAPEPRSYRRRTEPNLQDDKIEADY